MIFKPTKQILKKPMIYGFDIETYGKENKFLLCSLYGNGENKFFYTKRSFIEELKKKKYAGCMIAATNLSFDFIGIFHKEPEMLFFHTLFRGSNLISADTYIEDKQFKRFPDYIYKDGKKRRKNTRTNKLTFIDTFNYAPFSVQKQGEILKFLKLEKPTFLGKIPVNKEEWGILKKYNERDAYISKSFTEFLFDSFIEIGATPRKTIASTSMSLFKNKYLKDEYWHHKENILIDQFKGYYGGRTEAFIRGKIENVKYFDFNCFSEDTEILTDKGFKKYTEILEGDTVFSMKKEKLEKCIINKKIVKSYTGEMINLWNENTDQLVTPNHRIYYKTYNRTKYHKEKGNYGWTPWKVKNAVDIPKVYIKFPNAKQYNGSDHIDLNYLKLCAWYITEGHLKYNIIEISQSIDHNIKNCNEIIKLLDDCKIPYRLKFRKQKNKNYIYVYFKFSEIDFFMEKYYNSYTMRLPSGFINYTLECKKILFNELMKGDGSIQKGKASYVSYSNKLLDDVQILATMIGFKAAINHKNHVVYIKLNRDGNSMLKHKKTVSYNGMVWCVSVNNQNVVVRRNGKIFISGNSLYPSVMKDNIFPDPNSLRTTYWNSNKYINKYEGMSHVTVYIKDLVKPFLPYKKDMKVLFPLGKFSGWYTHVELRKAVELGYVIMKVHKTYYYKKTCSPFKDFIIDLYKLRLKYKKDKNPMEIVCKLLMNSLYGKFGQKFMGRDNWIPGLTKKELEKYDHIERFGQYFRVKKDCKPSSFCFPIWASYVTSYARIKLYNAIKDIDVYYCDTDSIMTKTILPTSDKIGDLKLEKNIKEAIIVRPKFYAYIDDEDKSFSKIKGVAKRLNYMEFLALVGVEIGDVATVKYDKFIKFKESQRRNLTPNMILEITKNLKLDDNKRIWDGNFNKNDMMLSKPIIVDEP